MPRPIRAGQVTNLSTRSFGASHTGSQPVKALSEMLCTEAGSLTVVRPVPFSKAKYPMEARSSGI
jgi:hypothetical protein